MDDVFHVVEFRIHRRSRLAICQALVTPSAEHSVKQTRTMAGSLVGSTNQTNFNEDLSLLRPVAMFTFQNGYPKSLGVS
jgi:hypothetical protein